jgi:hypothetical protein
MAAAKTRVVSSQPSGGEESGESGISVSVLRNLRLVD